MTKDFSVGSEYRARAAELQDIAALDRLAAQAAPPSALRRYAQQRATSKGRPASHGRLLGRVRAMVSRVAL